MYGKLIPLKFGSPVARPNLIVPGRAAELIPLDAYRVTPIRLHARAPSTSMWDDALQAPWWVTFTLPPIGWALIGIALIVGIILGATLNV